MSEKKLPAGPHIPLLPEELPQQRLVAVDTLPVRPEGFGLVHGSWPEGIKASPRHCETLCQLEWAWSPAHNRIQTWDLSLSQCGKYYLLETGLFNDESLFQHVDDNDEPIEGPDPWDFFQEGYCRVVKELTLHDHAVLLLHDALLKESRDCDLDHYHWINSEDLLDGADLQAIARSVWPK